jgi:hypothetical protein
MARDSDEPPTHGTSPPDPPGQPPPQPAPVERYGILTITRHVKDDGRALLLYTREESEGS